MVDKSVSGALRKQRMGKDILRIFKGREQYQGGELYRNAAVGKQ